MIPNYLSFIKNLTTDEIFIMNLSNVTWFFIFLIGFCCLFFVLFWSPNHMDVYNSWNNGTGILTQTELGKGSSSWFKYYYNGKFYEGVGVNSIYTYGYIEQEKYAIKINPKNPSEFYILGWKPFFAEDEKRKITIGEIKRVFNPLKTLGNTKGKSTYCVTYIYIDSIKRYHKREQDLPPDYNPKKDSLKVGQFYEVEYWIENPQRAVIHLDRPIKDTAGTR